MRGSSDGDTGGMWWLGSGATDPPPPPERRQEPTPPPLERDYREISAAPTPPALGGNSSPYSAYAPEPEPPAASAPPRASRPPVPPPPPAAPPRRAPRRRRHRATWPARLGLLIVVITVGIGAVLFWRGESVSGFALPLGLGQPQPTPTRIGFANQAKITFTRVTQPITAPASTLVAATDGSGQIAAKQIKTSVSQVPSAAQNALYQIASQVTFSINVANNSNNPQLSPGALTITSGDGKVTCGILNAVTVQPHATAQQQCATQAKSVPAESWNDSTSNPPLVYTGSSPAGGSSAYYYVPTNCGDPTPANQAARTALQGQLNTPPGTSVMAGPTVAIDAGSLACAPAAGTQQPDAFTFVQKINASASETVFTLADVQAYQTAQLQKAVPATSVLIASAICPDGPKVGTDATATKATITCPTTGTVGWNWTPDALNQLAQSIAGLGVGSAALQLNQTQGIAPGSAKINLVDGSLMPNTASAITFTITP